MGDVSNAAPGGAPSPHDDPAAPGSGAGASPPDGDGPSGAPPSGGADGERPGMREQLGRVRAATRLLVDAHLALLRAELAVIGDQIKQIAAFVGGIVVLALYAVSLLAIGGTLFLGEWIFGSIGWGVLHGLLLAVGIIVALALMIIDAPRPLITRPLVWGIVAGVGLTLVLGINVPRNLSEWVADIVIANVAPTLDPQYAPAVVAMVFFAVVVGIVGLIVGARGQGALGAISGLIVGALLGALIGILFGGLVFDWRVAAAIGLTVGLIAWIALMGWRASKANLDPQARFEKLWPRETYETALETRTWLEQEWTKRLPRRDSK
ncbi:MAG TPA: phage holin family protein [Candidatus Limnocylindrales bacterium]|jgi:hypothetical protein